MRRTLLAAGTAGAVALIATPFAPASANSGNEATVSVLHGVPGLTVDVYANGEELIPDFEPGTLTDPLSLPAGTYDLQVFADGDDPSSADPAIEANNVEVPGGARLTVRHTAAAPAVDVRADGDVLFGDLQNPEEATGDVPAGNYSADVALAGTDDVVLGPADLNLAEGTHTIVYAWGSAEDDNLDLAVQTIDGLHSAPAGVPGGEAGLAPETGNAPAWALGLGLMSALALAFAGRQLVTSRARS